MEAKIKIDEFSLNFMLYPSINLVAHTSNLLGISLGGTGSMKYSQKTNQDALNAIDYDRKAFRSWFDESTCMLVMNHVSDVERAIQLISAIYSEYTSKVPFPEILERSWNGFYKEYWKSNESRLIDVFNEIVNRNNWSTVVTDMESCTDAKMPSDIYVVATEATASSAYNIPPNISIGTPHKGGDCGLVHEGLHLLFSVSKSYKPVIEFMNSHKLVSSPEIPYNTWRGKIEQAVVITLDSIISKRPEYLDGCRVGDLRETVYSPVKKWYEDGKKTSLPEFLLETLMKDENNIFV